MVALLRRIRNEQILLKSKGIEPSVSDRTLLINYLVKTRYQCWIGEGLRVHTLATTVLARYQLEIDLFQNQHCLFEIAFGC